MKERDTRRIAPVARRIACLMAAAALVLGLGSAWAAYPDRPIKVIVPYPPGGGTDTLARALGEDMAQRLGQPLIIDNKPGANTVIGARAVLGSPADGYTLLLTSEQTFTTAPFIVKSPGYDPLSSFAGIRLIGATPVALVVHPKLGVESMAHFLEAAKRKPGEISYSSYGVQLNAVLFQKAAGIQLNAIPFKGAEGLQAFLGGQTDAMFDGLFTAMPNVRAGRSKALAVIQPQRSPFAPEVPSIGELGIQVPTLNIWFVLAAPKNAPADVIAKLSRAAQESLDQPAIRKRLAEFSIEVFNGGPEAAQKLIEEQFRTYRGIAAELNIQPE